MHVEGNYAGVVAGDCLRVGGLIIENMHHFFTVSWVLFNLSAEKMFLILAGYLWLHLDLVLGICLWGAPVGDLWNHDLLLSTGVVSDVVWLGWGVGICGVYLSRILVLRCKFLCLCNPI